MLPTTFLAADDKLWMQLRVVFLQEIGFGNMVLEAAAVNELFLANSAHLKRNGAIGHPALARRTLTNSCSITKTVKIAVTTMVRIIIFM